MLKRFALFLMALMFSVNALANSGYTNLPGGIGIGSAGSGTYVVLTGQALVRENIPLQSIMISTYAGPGVSVITTDLYVAGATGLTNTVAVTLPSQPASVVAVVQFRVPSNYLSGGVLRALVHASSTVTATGISVTADAFINSPDSATVTTKYAGTIVNFPTTANVQINDLLLTNSAALFSPGALVTYKIAVAGTDVVTRQILGLYFAYKPWGVLR